MTALGYILSHRRVRELVIVSTVYWSALGGLVVLPAWIERVAPASQGVLDRTCLPPSLSERGQGEGQTAGARNESLPNSGFRPSPRPSPFQGEGEERIGAGSQPATAGATQPARERILAPPNVMAPFLAIAAGIVCGGLLGYWLGGTAPPGGRIAAPLLASMVLLLALLAGRSLPLGQVCLFLLGVSGATLEDAVARTLRRTVAFAFSRRVLRLKRALGLVGLAIAALLALRFAGLRWPMARNVVAATALAFGVTGAVVLVVRYARAPLPPITFFFWNVNFAVARVWHGLGRVGRSWVPRRGGAILAATHESSADPALLQACTGRLIHWLIAREYFQLPGLRWIYRLTGSVPVNRAGQDAAATRAALRLLHAGQVVGIFPHGSIRQAGEPLDLKDGAALLALASRAPLVPARISGARHRSIPLDWLLPHRNVRIEFGRPIDLTDLYDRRKDPQAVAEATERLRQALTIPNLTPNPCPV